MTVRCAVCESHVCRGGNREAGPDFCPMHGEFPEFGDLYGDPVSLELLRGAAIIEARGYGRWTRIREVAELSLLLGLGRLGVAHATDTRWEAERVAGFLASFGLEPVLPPAALAPDPEAQADLFGETGTELNVVAGLGVAAEALFLQASHAPTVVLLARDRRLHHNPAAALYTSRSYLQDALHGHWPPSERRGSSGRTETLARMAVEDSLPGRIGADDPQPGTGPPPTRLEEAMSVAQRMGVSHLGISFCVGFKEEARILTRILEINGFQVSSACCKTGATPKEEIGIREEEKVRPGRAEMTCNPVAQAELLNRENVQLAMVLGQCVGHDAATFRHMKAPVVCLVAKDRVLAHNPVAALYR
ncbi:MAG: DUF1847 domain-containing protein [Longimicrobiales bacterium]